MKIYIKTTNYKYSFMSFWTNFPDFFHAEALSVCHENQFSPIMRKIIDESSKHSNMRLEIAWEELFRNLNCLTRLIAVFRNIFRHCCTALFWILHQSSSKWKSRSQCMDSTDHSILAWCSNSFLSPYEVLKKFFQ